MGFLKRCSLALVAVCFTASAHEFIVRNIVIQGNQRISTGTVFSYLPIHPGQTYTGEEGDAIITKLYNTGLFDNVSLAQEGDTLIVTVKERPTIGYLNITGNKIIKTKQLYTVLKKIELVEGGVYDSTKLKQVKLGLESQYSELGHQIAIVNTSVEPKPNNQVALYITVTEGPIAKVHKISFKGNTRFSQRRLRDTFQLTTPGIFTILNHHDRFSEMQLQKDLDALRNFYYDHGYLKFKILAQDVNYTPNHKKVDVVITFSEGPVYRISGYQISEKDAYINSVKPLIDLKNGAVFSRQKIINVTTKIANFFADRGYAFPKVDPVPVLNDANQTVFINFDISIGNRIYVRQLNISGNTQTSDRVVRSDLRQMEAGVYSRSKIEESKRRIQNDMPYLTDLNVTTAPVAGHPDQVDLDYQVKETNAGRASVQGGYSDVEGFIYGASVSEPNFMGSGRFVSLGFTRSAFSSQYSFGYNNPFYTIDGVSRGFNIYYTNTTPGKVNLESYTMSDFGANIRYGVPITEFDTLSLGAGYDHIDITNVDLANISPSVSTFLANHPSPYNQLNATTGFTHQSLDRAIFPQNGNLQQINLTVGPPLGTESLGYYTTTYTGKWFWEFGRSGFVFEPHAMLGYGNGFGSTGVLPFFDNFYGGGLGTLPGFSPNSLGPKNPNDISQAMGGNVEMFAGVNLFAPTFLSDRVRVGAIFNVGNVFDTNHVNSTPQTQYEAVNPADLRMAAGVMVSWWWPLGAPIDFSLAFPLNKKPNDQTEIFGFSMGGSL